MSIWLKEDTVVDLKLGPFLDDTDGKTAETALTIAQADVQVSKNGGAFAQKSETTSATHDADGWYKVPLDATDTNTSGVTTVQIAVAGALPVWINCMVLPATVYDAFISTGNLLVDAVKISGSTTAADNVEANIGNLDAAVASRSTITTAQVNTECDTALTDYGALKPSGTLAVCTTNTDMRGTDNAALASVLGALADAAGSGDPTTSDTVMKYLKQLVNVLVGTDGVTTFPAEASPANAVSLSEVLSAIHADVTGLAGSAMRGTDSAALASEVTAARMSELDAGTSGKMANQVDIIETDTTSLNDTKITTTRANNLDNLDAAITTRSTITPAQVNAEVDNALNTDLTTVTLTLNSINDVLNNIRGSASAIVPFTVDTTTNSHTPTTTVFQADDITEATADHYNGRLVMWLTGNLKHQFAKVDDYESVGGIGQFTVPAMTEAPANNDEGVLV